jgi:uracil-DNA glycosylase family 4
MNDRREAIRAHLEYYAELGVEGISRDPAWRTRAGDGHQPAGDHPRMVGSDQSAGDHPGMVGRSPSDHPGMVSAPNDRAPLAIIREDLGDCTRCKLAGLGRTQIVYGVGNPDADLMFIGEAPGADEDIQGEPFVGRAGQLLTKIIEAMGYARGDVYIANVLKCRPPGNRNPEPDEVATCQPFLFRQIDAVQPKVMVALGTFAAQALLNTKDPISRLRGRTWPCRGRLLVPTFHPAFLLRSPERKRDTWEDMKLVRAILRGEREA